MTRSRRVIISLWSISKAFFTSWSCGGAPRPGDWSAEIIEGLLKQRELVRSILAVGVPAEGGGRCSV